MSHDPSLIDYYARRAGAYERLYAKPERQADLQILKELCGRAMAGHQVLEIACGTGYWTLAASQSARAIAATDINPAMLEIAGSKTYSCPVSFQLADAFQPETLPAGEFSAGMAFAWWSHLRKSEIKAFLDGFHRQFRPGSTMVFMDNRFVAGSSTPINRRDAEGNTYQVRRLEDGSEHEVLKNFPTESEVREVLADRATGFSWTELPYYWFLTYRLV